MKDFVSILRALITGPALRHRPPASSCRSSVWPSGVAAVAAIHHANRSVSASFRDAARTCRGTKRLRRAGNGGVPVESLGALAFLWPVASFAPAVTGSALDRRRARSRPGPRHGLGRRRGRARRAAHPPRDRGRAVAGSSRGARCSCRSPLRPGTDFGRGRTLSLIAGGRPRTVSVGGMLELSGVAKASGGRPLVTDVFTARSFSGRPAWWTASTSWSIPERPRAAVEREIARRLPPGLSLEPPGRAAETAGADGPRLPLQPERARIVDAPRRDLPDRQRRVDRGPAPPAGDRDPARGRGLAPRDLRGVPGRGARDRDRRDRAGRGPRLLRARARRLAAVAGTICQHLPPDGEDRAARAIAGAVALAAAVGLSASVLATLLPALEATRVDPSPALRPGSIESVAPAGGCGSARLFRRPLLLLALAASRARPVDGFPLFGFAAVVLVVAALALAAPLLVAAGGRVSRAGCSGRSSGPRAASPPGSSAAPSRATASPSPPSRWRSA